MHRPAVLSVLALALALAVGASATAAGATPAEHLFPRTGARVISTPTRTADTTADIAPSEDVLRRVMTAYARIGLQTEITEMDVIDRGPAPAAQAHAYQAAARACAATPSCVRFTVWGVADPWSWRGPDAHALLLGPDYRPKPALDAVTSALAIRPQG